VRSSNAEGQSALRSGKGLFFTNQLKIENLQLSIENGSAGFETKTLLTFAQLKSPTPGSEACPELVEWVLRRPG
jgi:hypothetical protein